MMAIIFRCKSCWTPVTRELREVKDFSLVRGDEGPDCYDPLEAIPSGFFVLARDLLQARAKELRNSMLLEHFEHPDGWLFNTHDLIQHGSKINSNDAGCCGYIGRHGLNAFCVNGHGFATQVTDCCTVHFASAGAQVQMEEAEVGEE